MGMLNHMFGTRVDIAKEMGLDEEDLFKHFVHMFEKHRKEYPEKEKLVSEFSFKNVDAFIANLLHVDEVMDRLLSFFHKDYIELGPERRDDEEITKDILRLVSSESSDESKAYFNAIEKIHLLEVKELQALVHKILKKLHDIKVAQLHAIRMIKKHPQNMRILLLHLFKLVYHQEGFIYNTFKQEGAAHEKKIKIMRAILLEEEIIEEIHSEEDIFARKMLEEGIKSHSMHDYKLVMDDILVQLFSFVGIDFEHPENNTEGVVDKLDKLLYDDNEMKAIIMKLRPQYSQVEVAGMLRAFRAAVDLGHFDEFMHKLVQE
jgi:hypothetical protein